MPGQAKDIPNDDFFEGPRTEARSMLFFVGKLDGDGTWGTRGRIKDDLCHACESDDFEVGSGQNLGGEVGYFGRHAFVATVDISHWEKVSKLRGKHAGY